MPKRSLTMLAMAAGLTGVLREQTLSAQVMSPPPGRDTKWTAAVHIGRVFSGTPSGRAAGQFPVGATFRTEPGAPSRANPSWYFGDGAALFNEVNAQFASRFNQRLPQLVSLDGVLTSAALSRASTSAFGFRVARRMTRRFGVEVSFDRSAGRLEVSDAAKTAIEATRASFERAFGGLLATMPQTRLQVTSTAEIGEAVTVQRLLSGALTITLTRHRRLATHALAGGGRLFNRTDPLDARLRGGYEFRFLDIYPINEHDTVTIHFSEREASTVGVFGGGVTADVGRTHGVRADLRVIVGTSGIGTSIDASASAQRTQPFVALPSSTSPSLQFSTIAAERSSLNGSVSGLKTFNGRGLDTRAVVTVGYFFRF